MSLFKEFKEKILVYRACVKKDPEAFAGLYDLFVKRIYQFVFFKVGRREDAEDLTSGVFLKAWKYLTEEDKVVRNFKAFIYELARNSVSDFYRQKSRQETLFLPEEQEQLENAVKYDFAEEIFLNQEKKEIIKALETIKEEYRDVIILRYLEGLSIKEISEILKKTPLTVRVACHRAVKALKKKIYEPETAIKTTE